MKSYTIVGIIVFSFIVFAFILVKSWFDVKLDFIGGVIIGLLSGQIIPAWKYFFNTEHKNSTIIPCPKPIFNAGIIKNKRRYPQGSVDINFISEFRGKLKNGYFVNEITFAENAEFNNFPIDLPYIEKNVAKLPCHDTIDNIDGKKGKLNGCQEYHFTWALDMDFQNGLPQGKYKVKCMVFNENDIDPLLPPKESIFEVIESSNSNKLFNPNHTKFQ